MDSLDGGIFHLKEDGCLKGKTLIHSGQLIGECHSGTVAGIQGFTVLILTCNGGRIVMGVASIPLQL
ncbi:hypothetical protein D3C72_2128720 [compost metagenome]